MNNLMYSSGNLGIAVVKGTLEITLLYILTDLFLFPAELVGSVLLALFVVDAFTNLFIGRLNDWLTTVHHLPGVLLTLGVPTCMLSVAFLYAAPLIGIHSVWGVFLLVALAKLSVTLMALPHNALLFWISRDNTKRSAITLYRFVFSTLGFLFVSYGLAHFIPGKNPHSIAIFGAVSAVAGSLSVLLSWQSVKSTVKTITVGRASVSKPFLISIKYLYSRNFALIAMVVFALPFISLLFSKSILYYADYVLLNVELSGWLLGSMIVGQFSGIPFWLKGVKKISGVTLLKIAFSLIAWGCLSVFFSTHVHFVLSMTGAFIIGLGTSGSLSLIWSVAANCIDATAKKGAPSYQSFGFGLLMFVSRLSSGLSVMLFGYVLSESGFSPNVLQSESTQWSIQFLSTLVPTLGALFCIFILVFYKNHK
jgi:GPH family glycoside/pentoside/hexuronide:cation symporter